MSDDRLATFKRVLAACARGRKWTDESAAELIGMVDTARQERDAARTMAKAERVSCDLENDRAWDWVKGALSERDEARAEVGRLRQLEESWRETCEWNVKGAYEERDAAQAETARLHGLLVVANEMTRVMRLERDEARGDAVAAWHYPDDEAAAEALDSRIAAYREALDDE